MPAASATSPIRSLQGQSAAARRWDLPNKDDLAREYAAARIAAYVERTVSSAPPLTTEQRDKLALLLRGGGDHAAT